MKTSEQVHAQIRWDARFDPARFVVGIDVHGRPPKRVPYPAFVPGGDIPWHRVLFFEADGVIVWDRRDGTDRVGEIDAGLARAERLLARGSFEPRQPSAWDGERWVESPRTRAPRVDPAPLRIVTWNTLWDRYDADRIATARRRPLLVQALAALDADIIALQEVEPPLVSALLAEAWVRDAYHVSDGPGAKDVDAFGLLLLSRRPILELALRPFAPHKAALAVVVDGPHGPLVVVTVHLTSDHTEGASKRREAELGALSGEAPPLDTLWVGDFNDGSNELAERLGMTDAWSAIHGPTDSTPTFDPTQNPLARVSSKTGRASRLDRVFCRGELAATEASLVGDAPATADGLFVSDHAGLVVTLGERSGGPALDLPPTARTALAWLAPAEVTEKVDPIREVHDPSWKRWPAHVNVLYGFVPEHAFDQAAAIVREVAEGVPAFDVRLEGVRAFDHEHSTTAWVDPARGDAPGWTELRARLGARFPACDTRGGKVPHLTIAKGAGDLPLGAWERAIGALDASVSRVTLLSRRHDEPMRPRAHVTLGPNARIEWVHEEARESREAVPSSIDRLTRGLTAALPDVTLHVTGSHRFGCALPESDVDLVAEIAPDHEGADAIHRALAGLAEVRRLRRVTGARVPGFDFEWSGVEVDLAVARRGDPESEIALSAMADADAIGEHLRGQDRLEPFRDLARTVKRWARMKGLDSAAFGTLPGLAWLVLAAETVRTATADELAEPRALLASFFADWAAYDWRAPVAFGSARAIADAASTQAMTILTPAAPVRSMTSQVLPDALALVGEELYAAWEEVAAAPDVASARRALFARPPLHRRHATWAIVTVDHAEEASRLERAGRARGRLRGLLDLLAEAGLHGVHGWPRPVRDGTTIRFYIGLGRGAVTAGRLEEATRSWLASVRDVRIEWAAGGDAPTLP